MRQESGYWVDENNNKWGVQYNTWDEAMQKSASLIDCHNCIDCEDCSFCKDCESCLDCWHCEFCINCSNTSSCNNCKDCSDCDSCASCKSCSKCENCDWCEDCVECETCDQCSNCSQCRVLMHTANQTNIDRTFKNGEKVMYDEDQEATYVGQYEDLYVIVIGDKLCFVEYRELS